MKIFFKKLHRSSRSNAIAYYIITILYLIATSSLIYSLSLLKGVETIGRIIIIILSIIWFFTYLVLTPIKIITNKQKSATALHIFTGILIPIYLIAAIVIIYIDGNLDFGKDKITYTTYLITLNNEELTDNSSIGIFSDEKEVEGHQLAQKLYEDKYQKNQLVSYDDYYEMLADLYAGKISAMFVSSNYNIFFSSEEIYANIGNETKIIDQYSETRKNQDHEIKSNKKLTEPFTILLMGVDSELDGLEANQAFNGDTLMMITFNPNTLTATMFSMPRDMYVPIACRNNNYAKVNSAAAYGTDCIINTLQNLTDIPIDYYVKMNFKGVVDLVEAVGGITVDVEKPDYNYNHGVDCKGKFCEQNSNRKYGKNTIYLDPGVQTLNGEEALAYARCRALYIESDIARNRHQQQVVEALAKKVTTIRSLDGLQNILDAISNNMDTNISTEQIYSFYDVAKDMLFKNDSDELITIQKTYLQYYDLPVYLPGRDVVTSALGYYESSLEAIKKAMRINLELEEAEMAKTFSFSFNENYESTIIGKGLTDNSKVETLPSFVNKSVNEAKSWAESHNITYSFEYVDYTSELYNPDALPGMIGNQSVHRGTFLSDISSIIFYINSGTPPQEEEPEPEEETPPEVDIPGAPTVE